jgi:hypothetical protein
LKTFYEGWTTELTASVELAKPIYETWVYDVSSQWHKKKELTRRQPNKKKRFVFFLPYLLFFTFYFMFFILFYSFSFISTLKTMLCLKCWGGFWFSLLFLCVLLELEEPIKNIYVFQP